MAISQREVSCKSNRGSKVDFHHLGVYGLAVVDADEMVKLEAAAKNSGRFVRSMEVPETPTKEQLINALGGALSFPDYFGRNWDAVEECMEDLDWLEGKDLSFFIRNAERLLTMECLDVIVFARIAARIPTYWKQRGVHFDIILCGGRQLSNTVNAILSPLAPV